jgi:hypothetical protein
LKKPTPTARRLSSEIPNQSILKDSHTTYLLLGYYWTTCSSDPFAFPSASKGRRWWHTWSRQLASSSKQPRGKRVRAIQIQLCKKSSISSPFFSAGGT